MEWIDADDRMMKIFKLVEAGEKFPTICPICNEKDAHFFMHRHDEIRGGFWLWCSKCKSFAHMSGRIPSWWKNIEGISIDMLFAEPDVLEGRAEEIDEWVNRLR